MATDNQQVKIPLSEYKKFMEKFMNDTYGKACKDVLTVTGASDIPYAHYLNIIYFDSANFPNNKIQLLYDGTNQNVYTNYMEVFYYKPLLNFMKKLATTIFKECTVYFMFTKLPRMNSIDYSYNQKRFMKEYGVSFDILIPDNSAWAQEKTLDRGIEILSETCNDIELTLKNISVHIVTELPTENYLHYEDYAKNYSKKRVKYRDYGFTDGKVQVLKGGNY